MKTLNKLTTFTILLIFLCVGAYGQPQDTNAANLFQEYQDGVIKRASGKNFTGKVNYDLTTGKIKFIYNGQELSLENPEIVVDVTIGKRVFVPFSNMGFLEKVAIDNNKHLYIKWEGTVKALNAASGSSYGSGSASTTVDQLHITDDGRLNTLSGSYYETTYKNTYYVIVDGEFRPFKNLKSLIKIFPDHKSEIKKYDIEQDTDFKKAESVVQLFKALGNNLDYQ